MLARLEIDVDAPSRQRGGRAPGPRKGGSTVASRAAILSFFLLSLCLRTVKKWIIRCTVESNDINGLA
jgi:hypothetical protein